MFRGVSIWGGLISGAMAQLQDTQAIASGHMNKKEYAVKLPKILPAVLVLWQVLNMAPYLGHLYYLEQVLLLEPQSEV